MADEADVLAVRRRVGSIVPPEDADIADALDRLQSVEAVTFEFLQLRLAELRANPTRLTIDGDRTEDWTGNIAALERAVDEAAVNAGVLSGSALTITRIVRPSRER